MSQKQKILIVDDQRAVREELAYALDFEGFACAEAADGKEALEAAEDPEIALVLLDIKMPGMDGLEVLTTLRERRPRLPVVMISGHGDVETAVVAIKRGAQDFLQKPFDTDRVIVSANNALRVAALQEENESLKDELSEEYRLLGESPVMQSLKALIERAAPTEAQVLITGENGTGKELVARQIHARSKRRKGPFVAVNCAAIPADLIESELFGHEKGAFTGAHMARVGHIQAADGGTLFLDEVGDLAQAAQAKLLRALQERTITRLGGRESISVDVRVLAATNRDLEAMVESGEFREDLYYRLKVLPIEVPPLRERHDDIELLAHHFVLEASKRNGLSVRKLGKPALEQLRRSSWPGNVRELRNLCEAVAILTDGESIEPDQIAEMQKGSSRAARDGDFFTLPTLEEFRAATEKEFIRRKLDENSNNIKRTAERIGIQRSNLYKKLDRYGLK
ncbi:MAG: sigma-54 dependent transcriptional regulator [Planctomycetota bacterium]